MQRVLVIGCAGAGKSTLAHKLADVLGLPLVELDHAYWRAGWVEPSMTEWRTTVERLVEAPAWVMAGNYSNTYDLRMPCADTIIWLDLPRGICMRRVLARTIKSYGRTRPDLPDGCPEKFDWKFLRFVWDFQRLSRPRIVQGIERFGGHARLHVLCSQRDVEAFLGAVRP